MLSTLVPSLRAAGCLEERERKKGEKNELFFHFFSNFSLSQNFSSPLSLFPTTNYFYSPTEGETDASYCKGPSTKTPSGAALLAASAAAAAASGPAPLPLPLVE